MENVNCLSHIIHLYYILYQYINCRFLLEKRNSFNSINLWTQIYIFQNLHYIKSKSSYMYTHVLTAIFFSKDPKNNVHVSASTFCNKEQPEVKCTQADRPLGGTSSALTICSSKLLKGRIMLYIICMCCNDTIAAVRVSLSPLLMMKMLWDITEYQE